MIIEYYWVLFSVINKYYNWVLLSVIIEYDWVLLLSVEYWALILSIIIAFVGIKNRIEY